MTTGVEEIALYAAYTPQASPPIWLEAAPSDRAHREMDELRAPRRAPRCQLLAALKREVAKGPRR